MKKDALFASVELTAATLFWASTFPVYKILLERFQPLELQWWRYGLASLITIAVLYRYRIPTIPRLHMKRGLLLGFFLFFGFTFQVFGLNLTTATRGAFITNLLILFAPLIYRIFLKRRLRWGYYLIWFLALVGLALFSLSKVKIEFMIGDLLCMVGALFFGIQVVAIDVWGHKDVRALYTALQVGVLFIGTGLLFPIMSDGTFIPHIPSGGDWGYYIFLALIPTWMSFYLQLRAQPLLQTPIASIIYALEPVMAAVLAWIIISERMSFIQWTGGILLVLSAFLVQVFPVFEDQPPGLDTQQRGGETEPAPIQ